jgi:broad specificity phosphatase PhoE
MTPGGPLSGAELIAALQQGGFNIALRHAITDRTQTDVPPENLEDCTKQRNLNDIGREQARAIGRAIAALNVPIGKVLSSPYCRTRETAELAFGAFETELALNNAFINSAQRPRLYAMLKELLAQPPEPGTNVVLVTHGDNIGGASGVTVAEGEAAIFYPDGTGGFMLAARLTADAWLALMPTPVP